MRSVVRVVIACQLFLASAIVPLAIAQTVAPAPVADDAATRSLADQRFMTIARLMGSKAKAAPAPEIERQDDAMLYRYVDPTSAKRITITVRPNALVSTTVQGP